MGQYQSPALRWYDIFLVFTYIWQENGAKIPQMPGAQRNVNPAWE